MIANTHTPNSTPRTRRGAALLLILGLVLVMSIVLTAFLQLVEQQLRLRGLYQDNEELRTYAYSALEATCAVLGMFKEKDKKFYSPIQGWDHPLLFASLDPIDVTLEEGTGIASLEYPEPRDEPEEAREKRLAAMTPEERMRAERLAERNPREIFDYPPLPFPNGIRVDVDISDETGKIPLTQNFAEMISEALQTLDIGQSQAEEMVDCLIDWIDANDDMRPKGAEQSHYDSLSPAIIVPNRPLQSYEELRYIKGWGEVFYDITGNPNEKWRAFKDMTTLHAHSKINLNTAPLGVLTAIEKRGDLNIDTITNFRNGSDGIFGTQDDIVIRKLSEVDIQENTTDNSSSDMLTGSGSFAKLLGVECQLLRIRVTASRGDSTFTLFLLAKVSASSGASASNTAPITIQELSENREIE